MRILITGAGGQLGHEVARVFAAEDHHEVVPCPRGLLDLRDRDSVLGAITSLAPNAIVHAAAWTAVDACQDDPDRAFAVNALGTRHVADAARRVGATVCYISTDYVFDGTASMPYDEWSPTNPMSVYGRSKLAGEGELDPDATVVRTSWLCGAHGANFVRTMIRLASANEDPVRVVSDQRGSPSFAADVAGGIARLVVARLPGVFHVTNQGQAGWDELARATFTAVGADADRIVPISTAEYAARAPRPPNSVLDNAALRLMGLPLLPEWRESHHRLVKELLQIS